MDNMVGSVLSVAESEARTSPLGGNCVRSALNSATVTNPAKQIPASCAKAASGMIF
jgi:hypothetical protein